MKNLARYCMGLCFFLIASAALAGLPAISVIVSDTNGHAAFRGTTNADGVFRTAKLAPGNYVVELKSSGATRDSQYLLVVAADQKKVTADSVPGAKFNGAGVALRIPVSSKTSIVGQIVTEAPIASTEAGNVKTILGRRYYWVPATTGTNLGRWVEEGLLKDGKLYPLDLASVQRFQDRAGEGSMSGSHELANHGF
jgi:hypothetical protein